MGGKLKDKNKQSNYHRLFSFDIGNCVFFRRFKVRKRMNAKSATKKLQKVAREKEA
jgi:hypothetical protein